MTSRVLYDPAIMRQALLSDVELRAPLRKTSDDERLWRLLTRHGEQLHPKAPPDLYRPLPDEIVEGLLWGPGGEWTGLCIPPGAFSRENIILQIVRYDRRDGFDLFGGGIRFHADLLDRYGRSIPRSSLAGLHPQQLRSGDARLAVRFESQGGVEELMRRSGRDGPLMSSHLRTFMRGMEFDQKLWGEWMDALNATKLTYGCGYLRADDDVFDPLGLLADLNGAEWDYDVAEGCYTLDGDAHELTTDRLREALGFALDTHPALIAEFVELVAEITDAQTSFKAVARKLTQATAPLTPVEKAYQEAVGSAHRRHYEAAVWAHEPDLIRRRRF